MYRRSEESALTDPEIVTASKEMSIEINKKVSGGIPSKTNEI